MQKINRLYLVDFDRCLGNIDASFRLLKSVAADNKKIDTQKLQIAYDMAEESGQSFSVLDYIRQNYPKINLDAISKGYLNRAKPMPSCLLEFGADKLLDFLVSSNLDFCIMSCGENIWQNLKIEAAGLGDVPRVIVATSQKSQIVGNWRKSPSGNRLVPGEYFKDGKSKEVKEIILIDDKIVAFEAMPANCRGYLVQYPQNSRRFYSGSLPFFVKSIHRIDEIIELEILTIA
jgi:hypothetical protein